MNNLDTLKNQKTHEDAVLDEIRKRVNEILPKEKKWRFWYKAGYCEVSIDRDRSSGIALYIRLKKDCLESMRHEMEFYYPYDQSTEQPSIRFNDEWIPLDFMVRVKEIIEDVLL